MRPRSFKRSRTADLDEPLQQHLPKLARQSSDGDPSTKLARQASGVQSARLTRQTSNRLDLQLPRQTSNGLDLQLPRQISNSLDLQLEQADSFSDLRSDASEVRSPSHAVTSSSPTSR